MLVRYRYCLHMHTNYGSVLRQAAVSHHRWSIKLENFSDDFAHTAQHLRDLACSPEHPTA